jgi:hypothetical protein
MPAAHEFEQDFEQDNARRERLSNAAASATPKAGQLAWLCSEQYMGTGNPITGYRTVKTILKQRMESAPMRDARTEDPAAQLGAHR